MDERLQDVVERITATFSPASIFLYGSRARTDFQSDSDYELGVLYRAGGKISRAALAELNPRTGVVAYPFDHEAILEGKIDTPFPERIYLRDLGLSGRTVWGEEVVEHLKLPPVRSVDVLQTLLFQTGIALSAVLSHRSGDTKTAASSFSKSCLFGARCLMLVEGGVFPLGYDAIAAGTSQMNLGEHAAVVEHALAVRHGVAVDPAMLFKNLSFHNQFIKPKVMEIIEMHGAGHILLQ